MSKKVIEDIRQDTNIFGEKNGKIYSISYTEVATPSDLESKVNRSVFEEFKTKTDDYFDDLSMMIHDKTSKEDLAELDNKIQILEHNISSDERINKEKSILIEMHKTLLDEFENKVEQKYKLIQQEYEQFDSLLKNNNINKRLETITDIIDSVGSTMEKNNRYFEDLDSINLKTIENNNKRFIKILFILNGLSVIILVFLIIYLLAL